MTDSFTAHPPLAIARYAITAVGMTWVFGRAALEGIPAFSVENLQDKFTTVEATVGAGLFMACGVYIASDLFKGAVRRIQARHNNCSQPRP